MSCSHRTWLHSLPGVVLGYLAWIELKGDVLGVGKHEDDSVIGDVFGGELEITGQGEPGATGGIRAWTAYRSRIR